jgi:hypothetical protein
MHSMSDGSILRRSGTTSQIARNPESKWSMLERIKISRGCSTTLGSIARASYHTSGALGPQVQSTAM